MITILLRQQNVCLNEGEDAPDFALPNQNGTIVKLSDFRGSNVLLVFHPGILDETCKDYLTLFTDYRDSFRVLGTEILGINMDSIESNQAWFVKNKLGFDVLADNSPPGDTTLKYDCYVPEEGYGKRVVFLIDKEGKISLVETVSAEKDACPDVGRILARISETE